MQIRTQAIGLLGGTFDPIHNGHLRLAMELYERLELAAVHLIPSAHPPHRGQPIASAELRLEMAQLAIDGLTGIKVDNRELLRPGPSYMLDTLRSIRAEEGERPLYMILGMDAFGHLNSWYEWEQLINYAHILLVQRTGKRLPMTKIMRSFLELKRTTNIEELRSNPAGKIYIEEIPILTISSTQIRGLLVNRRNPRYLLPDSVLELIQARNLYQNIT
jgi:nicotinate-nucleotide adenylyltransferase